MYLFNSLAKSCTLFWNTLKPLTEIIFLSSYFNFAFVVTVFSSKSELSKNPEISDLPINPFYFIFVDNISQVNFL